jgi:hypothetical protein
MLLKGGRGEHIMIGARSERIGTTHTAAAGKLAGRLGVLAAAVFCLSLGGVRAFAQPGVSDASYVIDTEDGEDDGSMQVQLAVSVSDVTEDGGPETFDIEEVTIPGIASTAYTDCNCNSDSTGTISGGFWEFSSAYDWNYESSWGISLYWDLYEPTPVWTTCSDGTGCCSGAQGFSYEYDFYDEVDTEIEVDVY